MAYNPAVKLLNADGVEINPVSDESVILLRRIVKLLESNATVDGAGRQRVIVDAVNSAPSTAVTGTFYQATQPVSVSLIGANDPRYQFMEAARMAYATGIRNNLVFTS